MACSSRTRGATFSLLALVAGLAACGHIGVDLLPGIEGESDAGGAGDANDGDASISADAAVDAALDARDAGCVGPDCPGTYVSASIGVDTNPGTGAKPVKTIARAVEIAKSLGGAQKVFIAGGGDKYDEKISLVEGISLLGGYDCSNAPCSWQRDIAKFLTIVSNQDFEGVLADKTITRATVLEGLVIAGKSGAAPAFPGSAGMTIAGGSPTVRACRIQAGDVAGTTQASKRSIGIAILGAPVEAKGSLIELSSIKAGQSNDASIAVYIDRLVNTAGIAATIRKNVIRGGQGVSSAGIAAYAGAAALSIEENRIDAGDVTGTGGGAWGLLVEGSPVIARNLINLEGNGPQCPPSQSFCGGIHSFSSTATIQSNVIHGAKADRSAAVMLAEAEGPAGMVILNGNTLDGGGNGGGDGTVSAAVATRNSAGTNALVGKVRNNILVYGTNEARFGVYESETDGKQAHLKALENNSFWNAAGGNASPWAYHYWDGANGASFTFAEMQTPAKVGNLGPTANLSDDPQLAADGIHIAQGSPCVNAGTATEAPDHDIDGDGRPKNNVFDIGADEAK